MILVLVCKVAIPLFWIVKTRGMKMLCNRFTFPFEDEPRSKFAVFRVGDARIAVDSRETEIIGSCRRV